MSFKRRGNVPAVGREDQGTAARQFAVDFDADRAEFLPAGDVPETQGVAVRHCRESRLVRRDGEPNE